MEFEINQLLSLSTCSNSMALSTILLLPLAFLWREMEIHIWLWRALERRNGRMRR